MPKHDKAFFPALGHGITHIFNSLPFMCFANEEYFNIIALQVVRRYREQYE